MGLDPTALVEADAFTAAIYPPRTGTAVAAADVAAGEQVLANRTKNLQAKKIAKAGDVVTGLLEFSAPGGAGSVSVELDSGQFLKIHDANTIKMGAGLSRTKSRGRWDLATALLTNTPAVDWEATLTGGLKCVRVTGTLATDTSTTAPRAQFFFDGIPDGARIDSVLVWIKGAADHTVGATNALLPSGLPTATLKILDVTTNAGASVFAGTDASANIAAYESVHSVGGAAVHTYDASKERVYVELVGEYGTHSLESMLLFGAQLTFTQYAVET